MSTGRWPSIDHSAISTAPVSDAGTMAALSSAGMPRMLRVRSTAPTIFFLPSFERCERPTAASKRTSGVHPGRLAQGPDEKSGRAGREFGFIGLSLTEELHSGGGAWPAALLAS